MAKSRRTLAGARDLVLVVAYQLLTAGVKLNAALLRIFSELNASYTSFFILKVLQAHGPGSQKQLAWRLGRKSATLTEPVRQLISSGLIEARAPTHDRRVKYLCITVTGREHLERTTQTVHAELSKHFKSVTEVELGELDRIVGKVRHAHERAAA
jgi:DNA-binding MarR family transcriptional regulator